MGGNTSSKDIIMQVNSFKKYVSSMTIFLSITNGVSSGRTDGLTDGRTVARTKLDKDSGISFVM